ncbi:MAG: hypothetical protein AB1716_14340 [Planctomycetota bacterium]
MTMTAAAPAVSARATWTDRLRFAAGIVVVWAGLHFLVNPLLPPRGLDRPPVLVTGRFGPLAGLLAAGVLWAGAAVAASPLLHRNRRGVMLAVAGGLALWAAEGGRTGGTMADWLILQNEVPGGPRGGPYWWLLADYVYLLVGFAGAVVISGLPGRRAQRHAGIPGAGERDRHGWRALLLAAAGLEQPGKQRAVRVNALLLSTVIAGVAMFVLMGPTVDAVLRGQVYFAAIVSFMLGVYVAGRLLDVREARCYWLGPFLLGACGLAVAGLRPGLGLPAGYQDLNILPGWNLARALPAEMVGAGLVGVLWLLHGERADRADEARKERS